jgi:uncharacterized protein (TIGR02996 family)
MSERPPRPEVLALLSAAKETPDDDTPRLVLADWLEENGDRHDAARGELIRVQCDRVRLPSGAARARALRRERALLRRHRDAWFGRLVNFGAGEEVFDRGLMRFQVEKQKLASKGGLALAETEEWAWVNELKFAGATAVSLAKVAATSLLADLESLSLQNGKIRSEGAVSLARSSCLRRLRRLNLFWCWIDDVGAAALARSGPAPRLARLDLGRNLIGPRGCRALARWPALANVFELDLAVNRIDPSGAEALAASPHLRRLRRLDLRNCFIGDAGALALAESPYLADLESLDLVFNLLTDAGVMAVVNSPHLRSLKQLRVGFDPRVSPAAYEAARQRFSG